MKIHLPSAFPPPCPIVILSVLLFACGSRRVTGCLGVCASPVARGVPRSFKILYCACAFLTKNVKKHKTECWPFFAQVTQKSVLCLRFSHQKCLKNKTECWPFLVPLLCSSAFTLSENNRKIYQKSDQNRYKLRPGVVPGALGGDLGAILAPRRPKAQKTSKK